MLKLNSSLSPVIVIFPKISQCTALIPGKKKHRAKKPRTNEPTTMSDQPEMEPTQPINQVS